MHIDVGATVGNTFDDDTELERDLVGLFDHAYRVIVKVLGRQALIARAIRAYLGSSIRAGREAPGKPPVCYQMRMLVIALAPKAPGPIVVV